MPAITINVTDKIATAEACYVVCNNSDYTVNFNFDSEWNEYNTKTACFTYENVKGKTTEEIVFTGTRCTMPILMDTTYVEVGVFAGELHTTTPCIIPCFKSILDRGGKYIPDPPADVYEQIQTLLESFESIASIERTSGDGSAGSADVYTITYSDETTETFTIYNAEAPTYIYIKYAAKQPTSDTDMKDTPDAYMGVYTGAATTAPTTYTSYTWYAMSTVQTATNAEIDAVCV